MTKQRPQPPADDPDEIEELPGELPEAEEEFDEDEEADFEDDDDEETEPAA
jgi:hypothetical protein